MLGLPPQRRCRRAYTYLNLGKVKDKGIELGVDAAVNRYVNVFANYSYQWMPEIEDFPTGTTINDVNWPAEQPLQRRLQLQLRTVPRESLGELHRTRPTGRTCSTCASPARPMRYTLVNGAFGVRWFGEKVSTSLKVDEPRQPGSAAAHLRRHPARQVVGEVRFPF